MEEREDAQRDRITELKLERILLQRKTFTKWVNSFLEKSGVHINNIFTDFSDGKLLIKLLENISGRKIATVCMYFLYLTILNFLIEIQCLFNVEAIIL